MADLDAQRAEVRANYAAFESELPQLLRHCAGKFAVLRHSKLVDVFDNFGAALDYCGRSFPDHLFSIQQIEAEPLQFSSVTYASDPRVVRPKSGASDRG